MSNRLVGMTTRPFSERLPPMEIGYFSKLVYILSLGCYNLLIDLNLWKGLSDILGFLNKNRIALGTFAHGDNARNAMQAFRIKVR